MKIDTNSEKYYSLPYGDAEDFVCDGKDGVWVAQATVRSGGTLLKIFFWQVQFNDNFTCL